MGNIGDAHIHIEYGSPGVKGRMVWGGLVAFDRVWVLAHTMPPQLISPGMSTGAVKTFLQALMVSLPFPERISGSLY